MRKARAPLDATRAARHRSGGGHGPQTLDFTLSKTSPAVNAGEKITGFNDNAIGLPDIGPFERGQHPGQDWPRPRKTVFKP